MTWPVPSLSRASFNDLSVYICLLLLGFAIAIIPDISSYIATIFVLADP